MTASRTAWTCRRLRICCWGRESLLFAHTAALVNGGPISAGYCAADMNSNGVVDLPDAPLLVTRLLSP